MDDKLFVFFNGLSDDEKLELSRNGRYKIRAVKDIDKAPAVVEVVDTEDNHSARVTVREENPIDFPRIRILVNLAITDIEANKTKKRIESMTSFVTEGGLTQSDSVPIIADKLIELGAKSAYISGRFATEFDMLDNFEYLVSSTIPNVGNQVAYPFGTITTKDGNKILVNVYSYLSWNDATVYYE